MAQIDIVQRFLDAGTDLTQMTQRNAERLVRSLVDAGDVQANQANRLVRDLVEQGKKNRERLVTLIEREVNSQIARMGLASQADVRRLEKKVSSLERATRKTAAKKTTVKKTAVKKKAKSPAARSTTTG
jgi:polyhydroxyalkanoate synthesis regulator phasin